jgi:hypothetical protein
MDSIALSTEKKMRDKIYNPYMSIIKGEIIKIRKPPLSNKNIYLIIDPYDGVFMEF